MKSQPVRRHHNNEGRLKIKNGSHEQALRRVAARLGVPYGREDMSMVNRSREQAAHLVLGDLPHITMVQGGTRCHPWVAAAMEAKDATEAHHVALNLQALMKDMPAKALRRAEWRGYSFEVTE